MLSSVIDWIIVTHHHQMHIQDQYMSERIQGRDFTSGETCDSLLKEVEKIYAGQFGKIQ
jgi:hypothetical protein